MCMFSFAHPHNLDKLGRGGATRPLFLNVPSNRNWLFPVLPEALIWVPMAPEMRPSKSLIATAYRQAQGVIIQPRLP